jgi:hypothetical protein
MGVSREFFVRRQCFLDRKEGGNEVRGMIFQ